MYRREFLKATLAGGAALALLPEVYAQSEKPKELPNIVLIMADDVGYECFSCYGSREYKTPKIDALGAKGIRFTNCHSTPLCTPSRVNLMSGKSNVFNYRDFGIYLKGEPTFANYFKANGYVTAVAGKWQLKLSNGDGISPQEAGFDTFCLWNYPGTSRARYWNPSLMQDDKLLELPRGNFGPTVVTDFLIKFIKDNKDKPFLAYYPMILPHNPFVTTPDSANRSGKDAKKNFVDMVQYMDKCVGRIEDALTELGIRDKTLIIFTGDNGTNCEITSELDGRQIRGEKGRTMDHGTHVPLVASLPGRIPPGQVNEDLICFSDFFATMVEAAGLPPKEIKDGDGWSFWPQCLGKPGKKRDWIYGYYFPRPYSKKSNDRYTHYEIRYVRDKRHKLYSDGRFYDTVADVLEAKPLNVTDGLTAVRDKLQAAMDRYPSKGQAIDYDRVKGSLASKDQKRRFQGQTP
ncbi:sulfatase-like hydrolase/transferase [Verrucomicrobiota bacterium]